LSSGSQDKRMEVLGTFARELRQFSGLSASFFRVAAAQVGIAVTDMQALDILDLLGEASAGQLAELTGLTSGAITRILDRLEKAGLVRRMRDPNDGRRVIVKLAEGKDELRKIRTLLDSVGKAWDEAASRYDDEQMAFLLEFLKQGNELSRMELIQLQQEAASDEGEFFSAPLEDQKSGRLVVSCGTSRLSLRADDRTDRLYQARFEGPIPGVKTKDGVVTIHYPRRLLGLSEKHGAAEIALGASIPWQIVIQGGAAEVDAQLRSLDLAGLRIMGGFGTIHLDLPAPSAMVSIHITGGASEITVVRPASVSTSVHLKGWVSTLVFDEQTFSGVGNNARLQSIGFDPTAPHYDIEVTSYANKITIASD
jgi:DNA-binding MarR family transcriptional regulator